MERKQRVVNLGGIKFLVINLSEPLREDVEVFPGDPKPVKKVFSEINKTGYEHYVYSISDHNFHPHGDAPNHQNLGMKSYESFDMNYFFNQACMIDFSQSPEAEEHEGIKILDRVTKEHLIPYSEIISKKNAVIVRTGYDKWLEANKKHNVNKIPYFSKEAGMFLAGFKNIKVLGIDSLTVDAPKCHDVHQLLKEKLIVESLVNLYNIPEESRSNFDLQTSTIAIVGASGGPVAAFAFIRTEKEY